MCGRRPHNLIKMNKPTLKRQITETYVPSKKYKSRLFNSMRVSSRSVSSVAEKKENAFGIFPNLYYLVTSTQTSVTPLCTIGSGSANNQRVGRKIRHASVTLRTMIAPKTGMTNPDCGFMALVLDRQTNGATPGFAEIYDDLYTPGNSGLNPRLTRANQERFKILWTKPWTCPSFANGDASYISAYVDLSKLKGFDSTCNYNGSTSSVADINSGNILWVVAQSNDAQGVSGAMNFRTDIKYRFTDV